MKDIDWKYMWNENKNKVYIALIILLILLVAITSYIFISHYNTKKDVISKIDKLNESLILNQSLSIEKGNENYQYKISYQDATKDMYILLNKNNSQTEFYFYNNSWYMEIPEYIDNKDKKILKIEHNDIEKYTSIKEGDMQNYVSSMKLLNRNFVKYILNEVSYKNIEKGNDGYKISYYFGKKSNSEKFFTNLFSNLKVEEDSKTNIIQSLEDLLEQNKVNSVKIEIKTDRLQFNIEYENENNIQQKIQYFFETNTKLPVIDTNNSITLQELLEKGK